jgi:D-glycero-D-manno-heptose 1,7-bisphosphate phosphatase
MIKMSKKAVFLDRDGVITEIVYHKEMGIIDSAFNIDQIKLFPSVGKAIKNLQSMGFKVIIVSNQPGIAKDHFDMQTFGEMKKKVQDDLEKQGAKVDAEYYCLHHPEGKIKEYTMVCSCRKPKPGLLKKAAEDHDIDLKKSWMIGDGITDVLAGNRAGCKTILIGRMKCDLCKLMEDKGANPDFIAPNLFKAYLIIQKEEGNK